MFGQLLVQSPLILVEREFVREVMYVLVGR